jgi:hypothetical protein
MSPAAAIVESIIEDLAARKGIGDEWEMISDKIQGDMRDEWTEIVQAHLNAAPDAPTQEITCDGAPPLTEAELEAQLTTFQGIGDLRARCDLLKTILSGLLPMPLADALVHAQAHQSRTEGVSGPHDWAATVGRDQVVKSDVLYLDLQEELTDRNEVIARQADELNAAGAIITRLVHQLDGYGATSLHLPNEVMGQQSAATRMLTGAGLDVSGRRVRG